MLNRNTPTKARARVKGDALQGVMEDAGLARYVVSILRDGARGVTSLKFEHAALAICMLGTKYAVTQAPNVIMPDSLEQNMLQMPLLPPLPCLPGSYIPDPLICLSGAGMTSLMATSNLREAPQDAEIIRPSRRLERRKSQESRTVPLQGGSLRVKGVSEQI